MTHTFEIDHQLGHSPGDVLTSLSDPEEWTRVEPEAQVQTRREPQGRVAVSARTPLPPDAVPAAARSALPADPTLVQDYAFTPDGAGVDGTLKASIPGAPIDIAATLQILPAGTGSRLAVQVSLTCDVPLFGAIVERAAEPYVRQSIGDRITALTRP